MNGGVVKSCAKIVPVGAEVSGRTVRTVGVRSGPFPHTMPFDPPRARLALKRRACMDPESYLALLTSRLADGVARQPEATRARHAAYLRAAQNADGGFAGREGDSDLYYTAFGLRGLSVLDALTPDVCDRAAGFLRRQSHAVGQRGRFLLAALCLSAGAGVRRPRRAGRQPRRLARAHGRRSGDVPHRRWRLYQDARRRVRQHLSYLPGRPLLSASRHDRCRTRQRWCASSRRAAARTAASWRSLRCAAAAPTRPPPPSACCN